MVYRADSRSRTNNPVTVLRKGSAAATCRAQRHRGSRQWERNPAQVTVRVTNYDRIERAHPTGFVAGHNGLKSPRHLDQFQPLAQVPALRTHHRRPYHQQTAEDDQSTHRCHAPARLPPEDAVIPRHRYQLSPTPGLSARSAAAQSVGPVADLPG